MIKTWLRLQGRYEDRETNLYYNRHRYYDPDSARYLTQDPIGLSGGDNLYSYPTNPISWVDPLGLCKKGRGGRQKRLKDLLGDDKVSKSDKGWIRQELNAIAKKSKNKKGNPKKHIRTPPGKELAHERGREAAKGYGYKYSYLQDKYLHDLQHEKDDKGRKNKERPVLDNDICDIY